MDILVALPLQFFVYLGSEQDPDEVLSALTRLPKLVHFLWNGSALWTEIEREVLGRRLGVDLQDGRFRATKMGLCVLIVMHIVACLFLSHSDTWQPRVFVGNHSVGNSSLISKYVVGSTGPVTISVGCGASISHTTSLIFAMGFPWGRSLAQALQPF